MVEPLREFFVTVPGLKEVGGRPVKVVRGKDRVVLLTGAGERAFAAGADIRGLVDTDTKSGRAVSDRGHARPYWERVA